MSGVLSISTNQKFVYRVNILQVFTRDLRNYRERQDGPQFIRERMDEPTLIGVGWYNSASSARNYGSNRTNRAEWYNTLNAKVTYRWNRETQKYDTIEPFKPEEPSLDYRVYKVPITLDMREAILLPALKKLSE